MFIEVCCVCTAWRFNNFFDQKINLSLEKKIAIWHDLQSEKWDKNMDAQRGARTHDPEIKSLMLYRLS